MLKQVAIMAACFMTGASGLACAKPQSHQASGAGSMNERFQSILAFEKGLKKKADKKAFRRKIQDLKSECVRKKQPTNMCIDRVPATGSEMADIHNSLRGCRSDNERLMVIELLAQTHCLTVTQIKEIASTLDNSLARADALIRMASRTINPRRFHGVLEILKDQEAKARLLKALSRSAFNPVSK